MGKIHHLYIPLSQLCLHPFQTGNSQPYEMKNQELPSMGMELDFFGLTNHLLTMKYINIFGYQEVKVISFNVDLIH